MDVFLNIFPPPNLIPLLVSYMIDHIAISSYWIFFGIFLSEEVANSNFQVALVLAIPAIVSTLGTTLFSSFSDKTGRRQRFHHTVPFGHIWGVDRAIDVCHGQETWLPPRRFVGCFTGYLLAFLPLVLPGSEDVYFARLSRASLSLLPAAGAWRE